MATVRRQLELLKQSLTLAYWRNIANIDRRIPYLLRNSSKPPFAQTLREHGIHVTSSDAYFDSRARDLVAKISEFTNREMQKESIQEILKNRNSGHANKKFVFNLLPFEFDFDNPILQLALHPQLLAAANSYLGMYAHLQGIELWLNFPTEGEATETQLWHRDGDDRSQLKTFIYLNDVGEKTGPFCYIPESNPVGKLKIKPRVTKGGRVVDESMAEAVSPGKWKKCTGPAFSVTFADTCGYHKGLKPVEGHRLLLMLHYVSGVSPYPTMLKLNLPKDLSALDVSQKFALKGHVGKKTAVTAAVHPTY